MTKSIEDRYKKLQPIEHVLLRPGRYLGSTKPHTAETYVYDSATKKMIKKELTWNPGLLKMFDEVISNAVDHSKRPQGKHLDTIRVEIDEATGTFSVWDNGGIPVEFHKTEQMYVPTLIFGHLLSGENFDDDNDARVTGQNGEGASLVNIFSTKFTVETSDGKKKFKQTWTNNMQTAGEAKITDGDRGFTRITFTPDYARLGGPLTKDMSERIVKRVYDICGCNPQLKIYLNGDRIQVKSFKDYIELYVDQFEYDDNPSWQIGVASSDGFEHVSFVNSTETLQGGTHLYYVWYQIATKLREYILKKNKIDVKPTEIQSHFRVFINASIDKPRYDSQTKENLITEVKEYGSVWECPDKFINKIVKAGIVEKVLAWAELKEQAALKAELAKLNKETAKGDPRRVDKFSDAMEDDKRELCELYLTEGDSARKAIHESRGKNPYIGSFALKGKPLNVMDIDMKKIVGGKGDDEGNKEVINIMKITGLKIGVKVKSVKDLRFGKIVILSDQDLDGFHVSSLLINFFAYFWPELFELGIIYRMQTPLVIAELKNKAKDEIEFFTDEDYEHWAKTAPAHTPSRFKGLGKFKVNRFKKILETREKYLIRIKKIEAKDTAGLMLAFKGSHADERKEWLADVNYFASFE